MTPELETRRLLLRPLELADAAQVQKIFPQWEIVRYLNSRVPWPYSADGALTYYRDVALPAVERGEEWHWPLRLKNDPATVLGMITLMNREGNNRGFWLGLPWHGQPHCVVGRWVGRLLCYLGPGPAPGSKVYPRLLLRPAGAGLERSLLRASG